MTLECVRAYTCQSSLQACLLLVSCLPFLVLAETTSAADMMTSETGAGHGMTGTTEQQLCGVSVLDLALPGMGLALCVQLVFWLCGSVVGGVQQQFVCLPSL